MAEREPANIGKDFAATEAAVVMVTAVALFALLGLLLAPFKRR